MSSYLIRELAEAHEERDQWKRIALAEKAWREHCKKKHSAGVANDNGYKYGTIGCYDKPLDPFKVKALTGEWPVDPCKEIYKELQEAWKAKDETIAGY